MGYQRQSQTRKPQAYSQPQGEKRANYSPHPIEELQGWIGNRAMGRMLQAQPMSQGSMLRKPLFRGLSHEWEGKKQPGEIPVQAQLDETVKEGCEERAEANTQPSMGVRKPLFRGLSYELMEDLAQRGMPVQAKLMVGKADDRFEEEADRVAAAVVQQIDGQTPQPLSQGETVQREEMEEEKLQRKPSVASLSVVEGGMAAPAELEGAIQGARGSGQPLAESVREPMERAFGADFSGVRVHRDATSDALNQSLSSRAFTTGEDIFFRQGEYELGSLGGQKLLAHELTHVVQQDGGVVQPGLIQRAVGFEFELVDWKCWVTSDFQKALKTIRRGAGREQKYAKRLLKGKHLIDGQGFSLQAEDYPNYDSWSGVEVVTDAFPENPQGRQTLKNTMDNIINLGNTMERKAGAQNHVFRLSEIGQPSAQLSAGIHLLTSGRDVRVEPQITVGVRLRKLAELMEDMARYDQDVEDDNLRQRRQKGRNFLAGRAQSGIYAFGEAVTNAELALQDYRRLNKNSALPQNQQLPNDWEPSKKLKSLLSIVIAYLKLASGRIVEYAKSAFHLLARTDFNTLFLELPSNEKTHFGDEYGLKWLQLVQKAPNLNRMNWNAPVFEQGIWLNHPNDPRKDPQVLSGLNRSTWIRMMPKIDLLTKENFPGTEEQKAELESIGGYHEKVDRERPSPRNIFEIRPVTSLRLDHSLLKQQAIKTFDYIKNLNQGIDRKYDERR